MERSTEVIGLGNLKFFDRLGSILQKKSARTCGMLLDARKAKWKSWLRRC
jgi:hypothetical protein